MIHRDSIGMSSLLVLLVFGLGCSLEPVSQDRTVDSRGELFLERASEAGLDFVHFNGMTGDYLFPEIKGMGGGLLDYDNDGDLDLYLVQGRLLGNAREEDAMFPAPDDVPPRDRLHRNELGTGLTADSDQDVALRYSDVTVESGIRAFEYGQGVATGDYDNDGWMDIYVSNFGPNQLFRNLGDGTFEDVSEEAGVADPGWGASTTFVDMDHDGWLDIYVVNYLQYRLANHKICNTAEGLPDYCGPLAYQGASDRLFRNLGDGSFKDVSGPAGLHTVAASGLGVAAADFTGDGWVDLYVANDERVNDFWVNQGDGRFVNRAAIAGLAANMNGTAESSMGVGIGDMDNDGDEDIFLTHLTDETNTFYENLGNGLFEDRSIAVRLGPQSLLATGFGTVVVDYDNDGWLDIFAANGAVNRRANVRARMLEEESIFPYEQPNQLFRNLGDGTFAEVTTEAGQAFQMSRVSRGAAGGDVDNDGDTDIVVFNCAGPVSLLLNQVGSEAPWLGLRLLGRDAPRDMLGASVVLERNDAPDLLRVVRTGGSFDSASDPRLLFGLGQGSDVQAVTVTWPSGRVESFQAPEINAYSTLEEGSGTQVPGS